MRDATMEIDTGHEPFELQREVPVSDAHTLPLAGPIRSSATALLLQVSIDSLLTLYRAARSSTRIAVRAVGDRTGEIVIVDGRIVLASWMRLEGTAALSAIRALAGAELDGRPLASWARSELIAAPDLEDVGPETPLEADGGRETRRRSEMPTAIFPAPALDRDAPASAPSVDPRELAGRVRSDFICVEREVALAAWQARERLPDHVRAEAEHVSLLVFGSVGTAGLHVSGPRVAGPEIAGLVGWLRSAVPRGPFELRAAPVTVVGHAEGAICVAAVSSGRTGEGGKALVAAYLLCLLAALEEARDR